MSATRVTRRRLLGGALAAGAGVAAGGLGGGAVVAAATPGRVRRATASATADVVVVGAGLAGLSAARRLVAAGLRVIVLEARDRVGGRTLNHRLATGQVVEVGGQWVGPLRGEPVASTLPAGQPGTTANPQTRIFDLAAAHGIGTYKTYNTGSYLDYSNGQLLPYDGSLRIPTDAGTLTAGQAILQLDQMASTVPVDAPWTAPNAALWDAQTVETWIRETLLPAGQAPDAATNHLITLAIESVFAAEPRDISLLHLLWYIAEAGSLENLVDTANGAQDSRFIGGSQAISIAVAQALGDRVVLGAPVRAIEHSGGVATVVSDAMTVRCRRVIVAVPPHLAGRIAYTPTLSALTGDGGLGGLREQLVQRTPMGTVIKCMCVYPSAFWRAQGYAGQVTSDTGPVRITFDNSPYDPATRASGESPGVLLGFIEGAEGRYWMGRPAAERQAAVVSSMVRYFGAGAAGPVEYVEKLWAREEWTGGCYGAFFPPGVWTDYGPALRTPIGLVHWAGTETALSWAGYMEGAVESGERVAGEVATALGGSAAPGTGITPTTAQLPNTGSAAGAGGATAAVTALGTALRVARRLQS